MAWTKAVLRSKGKALAIHLGISAVVFLPFLYLLLARWFPPPFFFTDGGWQGLRIMLLVDMVVGPTLTFLIFHPAKSLRELLLDFTCIGLVQAAALVYGYLNVEKQRIQVVTFWNGEFYAVARDAFREQSIAPGGWEALGEGPVYRVYTRRPKNSDESAGVTAYAMMTKTPAYELHFLYEPFGAYWQEVQADALNMEALVAADPGLQEQYQAFRDQHPDEGTTFYRLNGYFRKAIMALDRDGDYVDTIYHELPKESNSSARFRANS